MEPSLEWLTVFNYLRFLRFLRETTKQQTFYSASNPPGTSKIKVHEIIRNEKNILHLPSYILHQDTPTSDIRNQTSHGSSLVYIRLGGEGDSRKD